MTDCPTFSYTSMSKIPTLSYTCRLKKVPPAGGASPYRPLQGISPPSRFMRSQLHLLLKVWTLKKIKLTGTSHAWNLCKLTSFHNGRYKTELTAVKPESNLCLLIHIVAITTLIVIWIFYMGFKFREDLFSRVFNFAIFYNREKREIKDPKK